MMIQKTELRIENIIIDSHNDGYPMGATFVVKELRDEELIYYTEDSPGVGHTAPYAEIDPIPLTDEWLEKFGFFSKCKSSCAQWNIRNFYVSTDHEDEYGSKTEYHERYLCNNVWVDSVHQLQNLYFALTGEELTIMS